MPVKGLNHIPTGYRECLLTRITGRKLLVAMQSAVLELRGRQAELIASWSKTRKKAFSALELLILLHLNRKSHSLLKKTLLKPFWPGNLTRKHKKLHSPLNSSLYHKTWAQSMAFPIHRIKLVISFGQGIQCTLWPDPDAQVMSYIVPGSCAIALSRKENKFIAPFTTEHSTQLRTSSKPDQRIQAIADSQPHLSSRSAILSNHSQPMATILMPIFRVQTVAFPQNRP